MKRSDLNLTPCVQQHDRWSQYFFDKAKHEARMSKDPSSQVGAVIVRPDKTVASTGWNGFPRGVEDNREHLRDRDEKYPRVIHAELNAILSANEKLAGYSMWTSPHFTCARCAGAIIQKGISDVNVMCGNEIPDRWAQDMMIAADMYRQVGTRVRFFNCY